MENKKSSKKKFVILLGIIIVIAAILSLIILFFSKNKIKNNSKNFLPKIRELKVHLIAHSHDDLGWLKVIKIKNFSI